LVLLADTLTEAAQIVGTLLVLSLTITPAAAAQRLATRPEKQ
jgi:zinc/manganese transport system permease protein